MAQQLNLLGNGQIIPTPLHQEMERSYLEYAMSVIVGRALPDVRDGLKPVHRRILYAMYELGLTPDRPYRKCARVVGDVLGKYHPHGDQSVYDALVRLVQSFSTRYPLLDGHGNFGSVDNDPPAAMRYTETRLAPVAFEAMLTEIGEATVNFSSNFDNSQTEPVVLPVQLPILLLNGCSGIAVGMATNIPPHNLGEIVNSLIALIDRPTISDEKLWELVPGPDFPTGGEIVEIKGIQDAYRTGRGSIKMRGIANIERISTGKKRRREKKAIVITELPYQVNKAGWIEKTADLVNQGRIEGISDIRDESDRSGMRVVIELKKDATAQKVLHQLYRQTALQSNFGTIMLALVDNKPVQLPLRNVLEEFLKFREVTLTRQYSNELEEASQRQHLVEGLLLALNKIDEVIEILRHAPDGTTAKIRLQEELDLSPNQGDSILAMPMRRLTGLEKQKLETELAELQQSIDNLNKVLNDRNELMKALKKELRSLKRKFGDERRTRIKDVIVDESVKQLPTAKKSSSKKKDPKKDPALIVSPTLTFERSPEAVLQVTDAGCIYWQNPDTDLQGNTAPKKGEDFLRHQEKIGDRDKLIVIADSGRAYPLPIEEVPSSLESTELPAVELLSSAAQREAKGTVAHFFLPENYRDLDLVFLTEKGIIKRLASTELDALGNRGLVLVKLKDKDTLQYFSFAAEGQEVVIATTGGRILRLPVNDAQIPIMGRNAQGNRVMRLRLKESLVGFDAVKPQNSLAVITQQGFGKRIAVNSLRLGNRGDIGTQAIQFSNKEDLLAGIISTTDKENIMLTTSSDRRLVLPVESLKLAEKNSPGDKIGNLKTDEIITGIYPFV
ncbi:DNA topoisomerase 4 subunit A [Waterburya agarophytonicola K14]|uniref:DNA topoisomerase (ATP-hydrolyzing) n=1 Tax=Waterburya agarophytonicola KI4 TaxID=2874699 RepID=A0A964BW64_9CYAN|nr:DNA topoisomerase (ATP-hydrolyzing) [Waterburya agarophytonicola]MCC0178715.1 DNA topoisomerase 4 subunit A [Waterburya agarophytonicola KI4]